MADIPSAILVERYRGGQHDAADELFHRYVQRLTALATSRLSRSVAARVDAEDVVQSAYRSFFFLARHGDIVLHASGDLWRLLVRITLRKVYRNVRRHRADCRNVLRERAWTDEHDATAFDREPTPAEALVLADELRGVLEPLGILQRQMVELRLQGHEVNDIAAKVGRSSRTVRRTLASLGAELERRLQNVDPPSDRSTDEGLLSYSDVVLQRLIGQGGMGKVYRASWRGFANPVAVKLLRKTLRQHETAAERFREEARLLSGLKHPGIVTLHGVGLLPDGGHFLVMDLVDGPDLGKVPTPTLQDALRWVAEVAEAIEYAHGRGIIHCDLKPSNLLLGSDGHVRVSDFGLARSLAIDPSSCGGTTGFMAPEQLVEEGVLSPRTDVYGLGTVLHALLPERPAEVEALCSACLEADPAVRLASAEQVALRIRALLERLPN